MEVPYNTCFGNYIDLKNLKVRDVQFGDIANSLANQCRYNGQTNRFYSVAEHSVLVTEALQKAGAPLHVLKVALLHDASEAYLGDMAKYLKFEFPEFVDLENKVQRVILKAFKVKPLKGKFADLLHEYDSRICVNEMCRLQVIEDSRLIKWTNEVAPLKGIRIKGLIPRNAKDLFYKKAFELGVINDY